MLYGEIRYQKGNDLLGTHVWFFALESIGESRVFLTFPKSLIVPGTKVFFHIFPCMIFINTLINWFGSLLSDCSIAVGVDVFL